MGHLIRAMHLSKKEKKSLKVLKKKKKTRRYAPRCFSGHAEVAQILVMWNFYISEAYNVIISSTPSVGPSASLFWMFSRRYFIHLDIRLDPRLCVFGWEWFKNRKQILKPLRKRVCASPISRKLPSPSTPFSSFTYATVFLPVLHVAVETLRPSEQLRCLTSDRTTPRTGSDQFQAVRRVRPSGCHGNHDETRDHVALARNEIRQISKDLMIRSELKVSFLFSRQNFDSTRFIWNKQNKTFLMFLWSTATRKIPFTESVSEIYGKNP